MQNFTGNHQTLPEGNYGGRAQRCTTNALLNLTVWANNQWAHGKFSGTLFVVFQAAFSTVNHTRLCYTVSKMGICPNLTQLTADFLSHGLTTFQIGDHQWEYKPLIIGLPQGSPLLVILYMLYNTTLLCEVDNKPETISLGLIYKIKFTTVKPKIQEVAEQLQQLAKQALAWGITY